MINPPYDTLVQAISDLKQRGYVLDFNIRQNSLGCTTEDGLSLDPEEFEIDEVHRFEGMTDPDDTSILYAIHSKHGHKGILVNGYGIYADEVTSLLIEKLSRHH